jgi:hypothetical protein
LTILFNQKGGNMKRYLWTVTISLGFLLLWAMPALSETPEKKYMELYDDIREDVRDRQEDVRDRREDVRDRVEDILDRREDVRDRREDIRDRAEDIRDRQTFTGRGDILEDIRDRREDIRDRREDRQHRWHKPLHRPLPPKPRARR